MIKVNSLLEAAQDKFSGSGARFSRAFILSVNRVSHDLLSDCGLEVADVTHQGEEINLEPKSYLRVYLDGVMYYMQTYGEWAREPDPTAFGRYRAAMAAAQADTFVDSPAGMPGGDDDGV